MAKTETMSSKKVMTPKFRVSFPSVFKARADFEGQEPKFSIVMLFDKATDISALKQLAQSVVLEKWGPDKAKWPQNLRSPFRDGDVEGNGKDGYTGVIFVRASSKTRPGLVDQEKVQILEESDFYGGCYARATINAFAYDKAGNKGVAFGLQNIQKLADGEPFSGRTKAEDDFDAVSEAPVAGGTKSGSGMFD